MENSIRKYTKYIAIAFVMAITLASTGATSDVQAAVEYAGSEVALASAVPANHTEAIDVEQALTVESALAAPVAVIDALSFEATGTLDFAKKAAARGEYDEPTISQQQAVAAFEFAVDAADAGEAAVAEMAELEAAGTSDAEKDEASAPSVGECEAEASNTHYVAASASYACETRAIKLGETALAPIAAHAECNAQELAGLIAARSAKDAELTASIG